MGHSQLFYGGTMKKLLLILVIMSLNSLAFASHEKCQHAVSYKKEVIKRAKENELLLIDAKTRLIIAENDLRGASDKIEKEVRSLTVEAYQTNLQVVQDILEADELALRTANLSIETFCN